MSRRRAGRLGEEAARRHLEAAGYRILTANYRAGRGEIDLVAEEGDHLVFVEVRAKTGRSHGTPAESITAAKRRRMVEAAQRYMEEEGQWGRPWRIDVVAVQLDPQGQVRHLEVLVNAVEA